MEKLDFGIKNIDKIVSILERILASESVHNLKIRKYHWNVESIKFKELHTYFEELYNESYERIDSIAERIRTLGSLTKATYQEFLNDSFLKEDSEMMCDPKLMLQRLLDDKETMIREIRKDIESLSDSCDVGTEDLLTSIIQQFEKDSWMLRSMLK